MRTMDLSGWSMDVVFVLAIFLVLACSILLTAILRPPARPAAVLGVYLLSFANIVLVGEVTNTFHLLNDSFWWLGLHAVLAAASGLIWWLVGKPAISGPWRDAAGHLMPTGWGRGVRRWPEVSLLGLGVALAYLLNLVLIWIVPPNNNDSLATHMARVGYWLQHGSFFPWATQRVWQVTYPVNMQLQMFWIVLFLRSDRWVELVQWLGAFAAMVAIFGIARLLGASRPQALFAGLLWATFPEILLEATTTQNDLVAGTLFAAMIYLLFLGLKRRNMGALVLSALALGLGMGTKQTLFFLLPGLVLVLIHLLRWQGREVLGRLIVWGGMALGVFLLLGAYMFVVNLVSFGHPMGPETAVGAQTGGQTSQSLVENLTYNTFRLAYQAVDPTGLPDPLTGYGFKLKAVVVRAVTRLLHFPVESNRATAQGHAFRLDERYAMQEDSAWYGLLFTVLVIPALLLQTVRGFRRKDALRAGIGILVITFLLMDAAFRPGWDPFQGRYFIPVVALATACTAFLLRPGRWGRAANGLMVLAALVIVWQTFAWNTAKPIYGQYAVWNKTRLEMETQQSFYMRAPAQMVEQVVPADATMGLLTDGTYLEYPFFRADFQRRLVQIEPPQRVQDAVWLSGQGVEYILVLAPKGSSLNHLPSAWRAIANQEDWTIYARVSPQTEP